MLKLHLFLHFSLYFQHEKRFQKLSITLYMYLGFIPLTKNRKSKLNMFVYFH